MMEQTGNYKSIFDSAPGAGVLDPMPRAGVASLSTPAMADNLARMGRYDDDQIAHVAEGEMLVPAPILKYYPEVREEIFDVIRKEGLNPEEFIVGGDMVARNPLTGIQEFGFFSKIFKGIKKIVKKLAPVILAVALPGIGSALGAGSLFGYGTIGQAALTGATAGGLGTLIQGGKFKDALKAAAIGGATAGLGKGIANFAQAPAGTQGFDAFMGKYGSSVTPPVSVDPIPAAADKAVTQIQPAIQTATGQSAIQTATGQVGSQAPLVDGSLFRPDAAGGFTDIPTAGTGATGGGGTAADLFKTASQKVAETGTDPTFFERVGEGISNLNPFKKPLPIEDQILALPDVTPETLKGVIEAGAQRGLSRELALAEYAKSLESLQLFKPAASVGDKLLYSGIVGLSAAPLLIGGEEGMEGYRDSGERFTQEELDYFMGRGGTGELSEEQQSYLDKIQERIDELRRRRGLPVPDVGIPTLPAIRAIAEGGEVAGPGTGTSDSIPALLSDGEFVMTAKAVRGAGNGNRRKGAAEMYKLMRELEAA